VERKALADLAVQEPKAFCAIAGQAQAALVNRLPSLLERASQHRVAMEMGNGRGSRD
jgi:hypothetical protein